MRPALLLIPFFVFSSCKKEMGPLHSGTITWYHLVEEKFVSIVDVPSAFTPGTDGMNDVFYPVFRGMDRAKPFEMVIFNQAGKTIFRTTDHQQAWDGAAKGQACASDRYVFTISAVDTTGYVYNICSEVYLLR